LLDGSAQEWVEAIQSAGLCAAQDTSGRNLEKLAPQINEPVYLQRDDCFIAAFPSSQIRISYGIDFPKVYIFISSLGNQEKLVRSGYATGSFLMNQ